MKRNYGLDFLKCICAFMVVCIHTSFPGIVGKAVVPICRIAVPLFFMITGYYYSNTSIKKKELKQIGKIFRLVVLTNIVYFVFSVMQCLQSGDSLPSFLRSALSIKSILKFVLLNDSPFGVHLWYLGAILYVLLIVFVIERKWDRKCLYPIVPILLLTDLVLGKYSLLLLGRTFPYILVRNFLCVGLPYFLIGDMLFRYKIRMKSRNTLILSVVFAGVTLAERYLLGRFELNTTRDHYIGTTFMAVCVFLSALHYEGGKESKIKNAVCFAGSKLSTNIYILHPMFIYVMAVFMKRIVRNNTVETVYGYAAPFIIFFISAAVSLVLYRISTGKKKTD